MPLLGAYIADSYLGRFKTIQWACAIAFVGHIILVISAIPPVIVHPSGSIACFAIGIVIMGVGVGGFKSNISPLIAEQCTDVQIRVETNKKGERVIMDPAVTVSRVFLYFYMMVNFGSLFGSISMVYAEKYVGFYLSFLLPTFMLCKYISRCLMMCTNPLQVCALSSFSPAERSISYIRQLDPRLERRSVSGRWLSVIDGLGILLNSARMPKLQASGPKFIPPISPINPSGWISTMLGSMKSLVVFKPVKSFCGIHCKL